MTETVGIRPSRKFANGTVHENASGEFQILDRFLDKDGIIVLKLQWLHNGKVEENKEVNVSASIYKFQKSRGLIDPPMEFDPIKVVSLNDIMDALTFKTNEVMENGMTASKVYETLLELSNRLYERVEAVEEINKQQNVAIEKLLEMVSANQKDINQLVQKNDIVNKLIEKL